MAPMKVNRMKELPAASSDDEQTEEPTKPPPPPPQQTQKTTHSVASALLRFIMAPMEELLASSSSEDDESSSDEVTSSDDEQTEEPTKPPPQQTQKTAHSVASAPQSKFSSSEEDSESECDSDSESTPKPSATKLMKATPKATTSKPRSKAPAKRPSEMEESLKDSKRAKKKEIGADPDEEDQNKPGEDTKNQQLFQRVWSEEDEIAVLKGLIDFTTKKGMDPYQDTNAFHDFIKKSFHVEFTRTQVLEKIRRLKKKYKNNLGKKGEDRTFSKLHEQEAYDLSKKLWGNGSTSGVLKSVAKSNSKAKKNQNQKGSSESLAFCKAELNDGAKGKKMDIDNDKKGSLLLYDKSVGMAGLEEFVINQGLDMIGGAKKAELEERWKKLQIARLQLFVERTDLIKEQTELVLEAMKSSGH